MGRGRTFKPAYSGTGSFARSQQAHASGQTLPLIRALLESLHHGSQAGLRTLPVVLGDRGNCLFRFQVSEQEGRVQITLYWPTSAFAGVPAL